MKILKGFQFDALAKGGYRDLTPADIRVLEEELAAGTVVLSFAPGQEWIAGERVEATWNTSRFILSPK